MTFTKKILGKSSDLVCETKQNKQFPQFWIKFISPSVNENIALNYIFFTIQ